MQTETGSSHARLHLTVNPMRGEVQRPTLKFADLACASARESQAAESPQALVAWAR